MKPEATMHFKAVKPFKIKVKDLAEFVKTEKMLYAAGSNKKLYVLLHAGPNVERYLVKSLRYGDKGFTKKGEAVKYFNSL
jgi:hypothetical protein